MIVKNEERKLHKCLSSIKEYVDQIVIVDTGSTDKTVQIAEEFGSDIYHFDWCDHFARARNESIKYATGEWIFWMDADEVLDPLSVSILQKITSNSQKDFFYSVRISSINEYENKVTYSDAHRLFPNGIGIKFSNRIHEQITPSTSILGTKEKLSQINLIHSGYNLSEEEYKKKWLRNLPLLEKMADENPMGYSYYTLAQNYSGLKQYQNAIKFFKLAIDSHDLGPSLTTNTFNVLAQIYSLIDNWEKAEYYCKKSIELNPQQSGAHYMLFKCAENQRDYSNAITHLKVLLDNTKKLKSGSNKVRDDILISEGRIVKAMGDMYIKTEDNLKALHCYKELSELLITKPLIQKIINIPIEKLDLDLFIEILNKYVKKNTDITLEEYDILGQAFIKNNQFNSALALYLDLYKNKTINRLVLKRIATLYAKSGNIDEAKKYIVELNQLN